jgi:hypothetical protein
MEISWRQTPAAIKHFNPQITKAAAVLVTPVDPGQTIRHSIYDHRSKHSCLLAFVGLPRFVGQRRLPPERMGPLLASAARLARRLEGLVRPRLAFLHAGPGMARLAGLGVALAGLGLMLPLPIPFSNALPAWAVVLLAMGLMERDGLFVLLGHLTVLAGWLFIGLTSILGLKGLDNLLQAV